MTCSTWSEMKFNAVSFSHSNARTPDKLGKVFRIKPNKTMPHVHTATLKCLHKNCIYIERDDDKNASTLPSNNA